MNLSGRRVLKVLSISLLLLVLALGGLVFFLKKSAADPILLELSDSDWEFTVVLEIPHWDHGEPSVKLHFVEESSGQTYERSLGSRSFEFADKPIPFRRLDVGERSYLIVGDQVDKPLFVWYPNGRMSTPKYLEFSRTSATMKAALADLARSQELDSACLGRLLGTDQVGCIDDGS